MQILNLTRHKAKSRYFVISALFLLLLFITPSPAITQDDNSINTLRQMGKAFTKIAEKASPAVVGIKVEGKARSQDYPTMQEFPFGSPFGDDFFDQFFRRRFSRPSPRSPQPEYRQIAQGSGFIISSDGYILTNNHLVGEANKVLVKVADNPEIEAKIIGTDPESDIAVVKIDKKDLPFLELADSDTLEVGEWVIAIGNPFGLSHTVTAGIVSAKGRSNVGLAAYEDFIQTDAAINPGNSGGPLLNLDGKVVGINSAIVSRTGGNLGIGLAIPVNMAKAIYEQLIESGTVVRGFLGVNIQDLTPDVASSLSLDKDTRGVLVPEVTEGSAADKAGMKPYDVIVEFNGQAVEKAKVLQNRVAVLKPGTNVEIVVLRDGKRQKLTVELSERPPMGQIAATPQTLEQLGLTVQELTPDLAEQLGYQGQKGVVVSVVAQGSIADIAGITRGALIIEVNRNPIKNTKEFNEAVEKASKEGTIMMRIRDRDYTRIVVLTLPKK
jgi:serine protease Do